MLERARQCAPRLPLSVEIEKPRPDIETLLPEADDVLFSRAYARLAGRKRGQQGFADLGRGVES